MAKHQAHADLGLDGIPNELGEYIDRDVALLCRFGWHGLIAHCRPLSNFSSLDNVHHPARHLLTFYKHRGALPSAPPTEIGGVASPTGGTPWPRPTGLSVQRTMSMPV